MSQGKAGPACPSCCTDDHDPEKDQRTILHRSAGTDIGNAWVRAYQITAPGYTPPATVDVCVIENGEVRRTELSPEGAANLAAVLEALSAAGPDATRDFAAGIRAEAVAISEPEAS